MDTSHACNCCEYHSSLHKRMTLFIQRQMTQSKCWTMEYSSDLHAYILNYKYELALSSLCQLEYHSYVVYEHRCDRLSYSWDIAFMQCNAYHLICIFASFLTHIYLLPELTHAQWGRNNTPWQMSISFESSGSHVNNDDQNDERLNPINPAERARCARARWVRAKT